MIDAREYEIREDLEKAMHQMGQKEKEDANKSATSISESN